MLYSVYRPELKVYDYYQTPPTSDDARNPPSDDVKGRQARGGRDGRDLGVSSERAGYRLPSGARRCGQGVAPKGMVVTLQPGSVTSLGDTGLVDAMLHRPFALASSIALIWWAVKRVK